MIVNEKALLRAMKEDFKGDGYTVADYCAQGVEYLLICGNGYAVTMERTNVTGELLGYIAKTAKLLPAEDEAYLVEKDEVEEEDIQLSMKKLTWKENCFAAPGLMSETNPMGEVEQIKPTDLLVGTSELWQGCTSLNMILMDPNLTDIIGDSRVMVMHSNGCIRARGVLSTIYLSKTRPGEGTEERLKHLEKGAMGGGIRRVLCWKLK